MTLFKSVLSAGRVPWRFLAPKRLLEPSGRGRVTIKNIVKKRKSATEPADPLVLLVEQAVNALRLRRLRRMRKLVKGALP